MYRVVRINETHAYLDEDLVRRAGGKIYSVYIYNDEEVTYLCELTPSYWLEEVEVIPDKYPESERERDRLERDLYRTLNEEYGIYVHCHSVDRINSVPLHDGVFESMEEAREFYQGNPTY